MLQISLDIDILMTIEFAVLLMGATCVIYIILKMRNKK